MTTDVQHLVVLTTCPGSISAKNIAQFVVDEKLAACANIIPDVSSYFRWLNKIEHANEHLLVMKTTTDKYPELERRVNDMHPNELPEIIAVPIYAGLTGYLDWITTNTENK